MIKSPQSDSCLASHSDYDPGWSWNKLQTPLRLNWGKQKPSDCDWSWEPPGFITTAAHQPQSAELNQHLTWSNEKHNDSLAVQTRWELSFIWNDGFVTMICKTRASTGRVWGFKVRKISLWRPLSSLYLSEHPDNRRPSALCIVHKPRLLFSLTKCELFLLHATNTFISQRE